MDFEILKREHHLSRIPDLTITNEAIPTHFSLYQMTFQPQLVKFFFNLIKWLQPEQNDENNANIAKNWIQIG